jgi:hypothetical protein
MNRRYSALALSALAMGSVGLFATEASARLKDPVPGSGPATAGVYEWPDEGTSYPGSEAGSPEYKYPNYDTKYELASPKAPTGRSLSDDNGVEALQAGASALGGAGLAFGGMWLYRRRQALAG